MTLRKLFLAGLIFCLLAPLSTAQKVKEKDLPVRYQDFLNLVRYIALDEEIEVFMQLTTDRDRDVFIDIFWKQRDPTPGTPDNEFKEEHLQRFNYANTTLARGTSRPGWMTDMGRIHIILGEPASIERFETTMGLYPVQVWYYYGDSSKGLPPHFAIVFFKRGGTGEWKLYDHVSDGPTALLLDGRELDPTDFEAQYEKIQEMAPTLALVSHSMVPGDIPFNYQPSPTNVIFMSNVFDSPKKAISATYATHFLNYRTMVDTEYMTNMIGSDGRVDLLRDPLMGIDFLHFSIAPDKLSIDYYEPKDQYFCNFTLDISIRKDDENIIFQYTKDFPFYFSDDELKRVQANGLALEDSFPVVGGKYKFIVLLTNSVGKEFSVFEQEVVIPEAAQGARIAGMVLGYDFQDYDSQFHLPYKILGKKLVVDPGITFGTKDNISFLLNLAEIHQELWEKGRIRCEIKGMRPNNPSVKSFDLPLRDRPYNRSLLVDQSIPAAELSPDYYEMRVSLIDETGAKMDERKSEFIISQAPAVAHPIIHAKAFALANNFLYFYALAHQYEKINAMEPAEQSYERAYSIKPDYKRGMIDYSNFLYKIKKFDKILQLTESLQTDENLRFEYFLLRGKAFMGKAQYGLAIENFLKGNEIYNSDISLLNSLGYCFYKNGNPEQAVEALRASLKLNSGQAEIIKLIAEIEKR